jgi:hypothetical protein
MVTGHLWNSDVVAGDVRSVAHGAVTQHRCGNATASCRGRHWRAHQRHLVDAVGAAIGVFVGGEALRGAQAAAGIGQ